MFFVEFNKCFSFLIELAVKDFLYNYSTAFFCLSFICEGPRPMHAS